MVVLGNQMCIAQLLGAGGGWWLQCQGLVITKAKLVNSILPVYATVPSTLLRRTPYNSTQGQPAKLTLPSRSTSDNLCSP